MQGSSGISIGGAWLSRFLGVGHANQNVTVKSESKYSDMGDNRAHLTSRERVRQLTCKPSARVEGDERKVGESYRTTGGYRRSGCAQGVGHTNVCEPTIRMTRRSTMDRRSTLALQFGQRNTVGGHGVTIGVVGAGFRRIQTPRRA